MHAASPPRRSERGAILLSVLVVAIVMSLGTAVALQEWSITKQRDLEKELLFVGQQYERASRVFWCKNGKRYPTRLDQLHKLPNRFIRRLYPDPLTAEYDEDGKLVEKTGEWRLVYATAGPPGQPGQPGQPQPGVGTPTPPKEDGGLFDEEDPAEEKEKQREQARTQAQRASGPIVGVASWSEEESFLRYKGRDTYDQWEFRFDPPRPQQGQQINPCLGITPPPTAQPTPAQPRSPNQSRN